jgi:hypothetical protein
MCFNFSLVKPPLKFVWLVVCLFVCCDFLRCQYTIQSISWLWFSFSHSRLAGRCVLCTVYPEFNLHMRRGLWGTRNALGSWQSAAYSSEVFVSSFGKNKLLDLDGNLLHTILQKTFPVLWRTNSWAYWLVLCCHLEEEAVEQITEGNLSTFKFILLYTLWVWADLVYLSIYHPLVNSPNPLVTTRAAECICEFIWMLEFMNNETAIVVISLLLSCRVHLCVHLNARAHEQWNCNSGNQSFVAYIQEWRFHCHVLT